MTANFEYKKLPCQSLVSLVKQQIGALFNVRRRVGLNISWEHVVLLFLKVFIKNRIA